MCCRQAVTSPTMALLPTMKLQLMTATRQMILTSYVSLTWHPNAASRCNGTAWQLVPGPSRYHVLPHLKPLTRCPLTRPCSIFNLQTTVHFQTARRLPTWQRHPLPSYAVMHGIGSSSLTLMELMTVTASFQAHHQRHAPPMPCHRSTPWISLSNTSSAAIVPSVTAG